MAALFLLVCVTSGIMFEKRGRESASGGKKQPKVACRSVSGGYPPVTPPVSDCSFLVEVSAEALQRSTTDAQVVDNLVDLFPVY